jgi:MFS family permease
MTPGVRYTIFFFYGLFNTGIVTSYTYSSEVNPHRLTGIALGITNMASVLLGSIFLPVIGYLLHYSAITHTAAGVEPVYTVADYQFAFAFLPICLLLAFIISFTLRETHCTRVEDLQPRSLDTDATISG